MPTCWRTRPIPSARQVVAQPGACMNCHASTYVAYKKAGNGDITKGFERINQMPFADAIKLVKHPVSCIDCHDSQTLALRVTRPAFIEGMRALKASQGIKDYDVNKQATRQEMRAYVCGQCHVEYYFQGAERRLVFPWSKGLKVENIMAYYDEIGFRDWTHRDTGAPALKAQHPEFEMWSQGVHARSGVTCSDCHMPRMEYKGATVSDHWVRSPMLNIKNACLGCHQRHDAKITEQDLKDRVDEIQDRHWKLRQDAMTALVGLIDDLKAARAAGRDRRRSQDRALFATPGAVLSRLRRGGELDRFPCAAGGGPHSRRIDELLSPGPDRRARPELQADSRGRRHSAAAETAAAGTARCEIARNCAANLLRVAQSLPCYAASFALFVGHEAEMVRPGGNGVTRRNTRSPIIRWLRYPTPF